MNANDLTLAQLRQIVSALEQAPRSPKSKAVALDAITKWAGHRGLTLEHVLLEAPGLFLGNYTMDTFRDELLEACAAKLRETVPPAEAEAAQPAEPARGPKVDRLIPLATGRGFTLEEAREVLCIPHPKARALAGALARKLGGDVVAYRDGAATRYRVVLWERVG